MRLRGNINLLEAEAKRNLKEEQGHYQITNQIK